MKIVILVIFISILLSSCVRIGVGRRWAYDGYHCGPFNSDIVIIDSIRKRQ